MFIEVNEKLLDELKHTAEQLRKVEKLVEDHSTLDILNDIRSGYTLLESIVDSAEKGVEAHPRLINREGHTHVLLTSFYLSNEWLGDIQEQKGE